MTATQEPTFIIIIITIIFIIIITSTSIVVIIIVILNFIVVDKVVVLVIVIKYLPKLWRHIIIIIVFDIIIIVTNTISIQLFALRFIHYVLVSLFALVIISRWSRDYSLDMVDGRQLWNRWLLSNYHSYKIGVRDGEGATCFTPIPMIIYTVPIFWQQIFVISISNVNVFWWWNNSFFY